MRGKVDPPCNGGSCGLRKLCFKIFSFGGSSSNVDRDKRILNARHQFVVNYSQLS
jgi:hypothetical protein